MYFIKITSSYSAKNSLQKYLLDQLSKLECLTIQDPDELKKHLDRLVLRANMAYKRCTPTKAHLTPAHTKGDYTAGVGDLMQLSVYKQRGEFVSLEQQRQVRSQPPEGEQATLFPFQPLV